MVTRLQLISGFRDEAFAPGVNPGAAEFIVWGKDIYDPSGNKFIPVGMNGTAAPGGSGPQGWFATNNTYVNGHSDMFSSTNFVHTDVFHYQPLPPARLVDTRLNGSTVDNLYEATGPLIPGSKHFQIAGRGGVAVDAEAVVLNITTESSFEESFIVMWPVGVTHPPTSIMRTEEDVTKTTTVIMPVGPTGAISIYTQVGSTDMTIEALGYFSNDHGFYTTDQVRLLDTRFDSPTVDSQFEGTGKYIAAETRNLSVLGRGGVPSTGVSSVVLNVTAYDASVDTSVKVWAAGNAKPANADLYASTNTTNSTMCIVPIGASGQVSLENLVGTVDITVDVHGYFLTTESGYTSINQIRLMDTRAGQDTDDRLYNSVGQLTANVAYPIQVCGRMGTPFGATAAVLKVTAFNSVEDGSLILWGDGIAPDISQVRFTDGKTTSNTTIVPLSSLGFVHLKSSKAVDVAVDIVGWLPAGKMGWGCNFLKLNVWDPPSSYTSQDIIEGIYAAADEYTSKGVVVCASNYSYSADYTNAKNPRGMPSYDDLYADPFFVSLFEGWINRYKNNPRAWLYPLSQPWRSDNLSGWDATGTALFNRARSLGWTGVFVWDLPHWGLGLDLVATTTICEDFLKDKKNAVLGWHHYNNGSYENKTKLAQTAADKDIPIIISEVGNRVNYSPDQMIEKTGEDISVDWCRDNAFNFGLGFVAWQGTGNISNEYVLGDSKGTSFYQIREASTDGLVSTPTLSPLGVALRKVSNDLMVYSRFR
jgi:hypothetical protein